MRQLQKWRRVIVGLAAVGILAMAWPAYVNVRGTMLINDARDALSRGDAPTALHTMERMPKSYMQRPESQFLLARAFRHLNKVREFKQFGDQAAALGWPVEQLSRQQMLWQVQNGDLRLAEKVITSERVTDLSDDEASEMYDAYIRGCIRTYHLPQALNAIDKWLAWKPRQVAPLYYRGMIYVELEQSDMAMETFQESLALDPRNYATRRQVAIILSGKNRIKEAIAMAEVLVQEIPTEPSSRLLLAECQERTGKADEAEATLLPLLKQDIGPYYRGQTLLKLSRLAALKNQRDEAAAYLEEAVELQPLNAAILYAAGTALIRNGQKDRGKQFVDRSKALTDKAPLLKDKKEQAQRRPGDAGLRYEVGKLTLDMGDVEEGIAWIQQALSIDPRHRGAHEEMAKYFESLDREKEAAVHRRVLEALGPAPEGDLPDADRPDADPPEAGAKSSESDAPPATTRPVDDEPASASKSG